MALIYRERLITRDLGSGFQAWRIARIQTPRLKRKHSLITDWTKRRGADCGIPEDEFKEDRLGDNILEHQAVEFGFAGSG